MAILGIDYGKKRVGLAFSESGIQAEPLQIIHHSSRENLINQLQIICNQQEVEEIVVGVPERDSIGARDFGQKLEKRLNLKVSFFNEDLTSWASAALHPKKELTDDLAAVLILQGYIDDKNP